MDDWVSRQGLALRKKTGWYWLRATLVLMVGLWLGGCLGESDLWLEQRRTTYRLLHKLSPRESHPRWIALILIEDDEYWLGELAGRKPIRRDYLARLAQAAAKGNPALVALDFDLRSPSPEGDPVEHSAYQQETEVLLKTIREISMQCPVIIPKTLRWGDCGYTTDSDIYDRYDFGDARVLKGYIALPRDERSIPTVPLLLQNGGTLDSFARAIVRAVHPEILCREVARGETLPYADFMDLDAFTRVSAHDVLRNDPSALSALAHRLVIIGAHWHVSAVDRRELVDLHGSPNGDMSGVALHANYVEAMLDSRVHPVWSPLALHVVEGFGAALVVLIFAFEIGPISKALAVGGLVLTLVVLSAFSLLVFGLVFDFFVPVVGAIGHGLFEQVLEWRDKALTRTAKPSEPSGARDPR